MKQIVLLGNLNKWEQETEFIIEMLHLTASRVVTVNIGPKLTKADLNPKDLHKLYPGNNLKDCVNLAVAKMYTQGVADGLLCLVDDDPELDSVIDCAFEALPFGLPKAALVSGASSWQGNRQVIRVELPGLGYSMNPVIKICLSNVVFAVSGMALCNIHNFGSTTPTIGLCDCQGAIRFLQDLKLNYLCFSPEDNYARTLVAYGYIHGLLLEGECKGLANWIKAANTREIPVVISSRNPLAVKAEIASIIESVSTPVVVISPDCPRPRSQSRAAAAGSAQDWFSVQPVPYKYGTRSFYFHAAKILHKLLV